MIIVDTSVWIDHLRQRDEEVERLLKRRHVLAHPFITGELALGMMPRYDPVTRSLSELPQAAVADPTEVLFFIRTQQLQGSGIGYVDVHVLASTFLSADALLWTRDRRLAKIATALGVGHVG